MSRRFPLRNLPRRRRRSGFTLMEVLLVLAILVMLASVAFVTFGDYFNDANLSIAKTQIDAVKTPIAAFQMSEGRPPQRLEELYDMSTPKVRKYIEPIGADPWGNPYQFSPADPADPSVSYRIWSMGPDGQTGTNDDIGNWTNY